MLLIFFQIGFESDHVTTHAGYFFFVFKFQCFGDAFLRLSRDGTVTSDGIGGGR